MRAGHISYRFYPSSVQVHSKQITRECHGSQCMEMEDSRDRSGVRVHMAMWFCISRPLGHWVCESACVALVM
uniref:Uncharacterized protein n=1 Tax=Arundo donax TaxID=35708 RepID=A0A0A9H702_ARUDO